VKNSIKTNFRLEGVTQLQALMSGFKISDQEQVLVESLREAAAPVVRDARANLQKNKSVRTWALWKAMGFVVRRYRSRGLYIAYIGARQIDFAMTPETKSVRLSANRQVKAKEGESKISPWRYIHLVEYPFFNVRTGRKTPGKPFLKPAFDQNIAQAEKTLLAGFEKAVARFWQKSVAKATKNVFKKAA